MTAIDVWKIKETLKERGPDRVVINASGEAVSSLHACRDYNIEPVLIFIRDDYWMLGAPDHLVEVAEGLWVKEWVAVWKKGDRAPISYEVWKERQVEGRKELKAALEQLYQSARAVVKVLENVQDQHGVVHRARKLLQLEISHIEKAKEKING